MDEATKAHQRRKLDPRYNTWIKGDAIDIGCGNDPITSEMYPNLKSVMPYDFILGHKDAGTLPELPVAMTFDCVHSSHCLEHLEDPMIALHEWWNRVKPDGHLVVTVPDEDAYEKGVFPSRFNGDHKTTWTIWKKESWSPVSRSVLGLLIGLPYAKIKLVQLLDYGVNYEARDVDQTISVTGPECAIEFVVQRDMRQAGSC